MIYLKRNIVDKKWFNYTYVPRIIYNYNYNLSKLKKVKRLKKKLKRFFFY